MTDIVDRLRSLYVQHGTNYVQEAADIIEALRTDNATLRAAIQTQAEEAAKLMRQRDELLAALEDALSIFGPEPGEQCLAPKWHARATAAITNATKVEA